MAYLKWESGSVGLFSRASLLSSGGLDTMKVGGRRGGEGKYLRLPSALGMSSGAS